MDVFESRLLTKVQSSTKTLIEKLIASVSYLYQEEEMAKHPKYKEQLFHFLTLLEKAEMNFDLLDEDFMSRFDAAIQDHKKSIERRKRQNKVWNEKFIGKIEEEGMKS